MLTKNTTTRSTQRPGVATVELAVVLPFLIFLIAVGTDFARIYYFAQTLETCAYNGAVYASDVYVRQRSIHGANNLTTAALADATDISDPSNPPTVTSITGTDSSGQQYVEVAVTCKFRMVTQFMWIPNEWTLTRRVRAAIAPVNPDGS